jgi:hypothetical protein
VRHCVFVLVVGVRYPNGGALELCLCCDVQQIYVYVVQLVCLGHTPNVANYQRRCCAVTLRRATARNKQTLVLYLYPKVRGGESDAKFYEESLCECDGVVGKFCWCCTGVEY